MSERIEGHAKRLGVWFGEEHDLDENAIKRLIRKCELARVPFSIRGGVFFVGEEPLGVKVEEVSCGADCPCKVKPAKKDKPAEKPVV